MSSCGIINKTITMDGTDKKFVSASEIWDFSIYVDPDASADITVTVDGVAATWFKGMTRTYTGVDLFKFSFNGGASGDTQKVTCVGQTQPVR